MLGAVRRADASGATERSMVVALVSRLLGAVDDRWRDDDGGAGDDDDNDDDETPIIFAILTHIDLNGKFGVILNQYLLEFVFRRI